MHYLQNSGGKHTSGYVIITEPDAPTIEGETLSCCHCQFTWIVKPGSGLKRGWCYKCNKPVCGKKKCLEKCAPWEMQMEIAEGKRRFWQQIARLNKDVVAVERVTPKRTGPRT